MPIYEYKCLSCEHQFEALVSSSSKAKCPECESAKLEQQYSAFAMGAPKGKGRFGKSAPAAKSGGGCGHCHEPGGCKN